jgi:PPOX class probable F420-dependent enzyme
MDNITSVYDTQDILKPFRVSRFAALTSFKRDGQGVTTPIGLYLADGKAYFITYSTSWKIKRIANNSQVTLAPCTQRGKVTGGAIKGTARRLEGSEREQKFIRVANSFNRWLFQVIYKVRFKATPVLFEVTPDEAS